MSAEQITQRRTAPRKAGLRLVQAPVARVSTLGFVGILVLLIAAGLSGVMVVTTTVSAQSRELTELRQEVTVLEYRAEGLESEYQRVTSTNALALRAAELGLVPNPYPVFINIENGTLTGEPTPVTGDEMPFLQGRQTRQDPAAAQQPAEGENPETQEIPASEESSTAADSTQEQP